MGCDGGEGKGRGWGGNGRGSGRDGGVMGERGNEVDEYGVWRMRREGVTREEEERGQGEEGTKQQRQI